MGHHRDYSNDYNDYTLPTFLEGSVNVEDKNLVIELGEGAFTLDYSLLIHQHNVTIKGQGSTKTYLNVPINIDYVDDAIINIQGLDGNEVSISIECLTIWASVIKHKAEQRAYKLTQNESHLIKCFHVKSFYMRDVRVWADNIATTCIDIRRGTNIDIRGCQFRSHNCRWTGGGIWLRGDIENVVIEDNDFYKYGNDEIIALFDVNSFIGVNDYDEITKKNVEIRYNRIYCQGSESSIITETGSRGTWDGCNQRFITVFTDQDNNKEFNSNNERVQRSTPCRHIVNGVHLHNNEFFINAPVSHLFTAAFDKYTTFKDVTVTDNVINYGEWTVNGNSSSPKELMDFGLYYDTIYDSSVNDGNYDAFCDEPFVISGNTINCGTNIRNIRSSDGVEYYVDNHICVDLMGTKVIFNDNLIRCTREAYSSDEADFANKGIQLFHSGYKGGEVIFNNNHCEGLIALMIFASSGDALTKGRVYGTGNYLQGNTRIVQVNILENHVMLAHNEIICDYPIFFLEEFANSGTASFIGNRVYHDISRVTRFSAPYGHIYYTGDTGSGNNVQSMRLICCDNIFDNINQYGMYSYLLSVSKMRAKHANNIFADLFE